VLVPEAVVTELDKGGVQGVDVPDVSGFPWIEIRETELRPVSAAVSALGNGERAVILLAIDRHADWVILDDLAARRQAEECGLQVIGTVGLLASAKRKNMIASVGPFLSALENAGMWLSEDLKRTVLESADEL
jgi:predicted nucleic acid-binding protein